MQPRRRRQREFEGQSRVLVINTNLALRSTLRNKVDKSWIHSNMVDSRKILLVPQQRHAIADGIPRVIFSADKVGTLESHPDIKTVETNGEMKIQ